MLNEDELIRRFEALTEEIVHSNGRAAGFGFDEENLLDSLPGAYQRERMRLMNRLSSHRRRRGETLLTMIRQVETGAAKLGVVWSTGRRRRNPRSRSD